MKDAFTEQLARQLADYFRQQNTLITQGTVGSDGLTLTPQQIMEVMQGNRDWLNQFESALEDSFRRVADNALEYWLSNTDREIRQSLQSFALLSEQASAGRASTGNTGGSALQRTLGTALDRGSKALFRNLFTRDRQNERESERSSESSSRYRASRGQIQAELSKELSRGKRYT